MPFATAEANAVLDARLAAYSNIYISLHNGSPLADDSGATELSGSGYARVNAPNGTHWAAAAGSQKKNSAIITFPTSTAAWGKVTHFGIYDASSGGNLKAFGDLVPSRTIENGVAPSFPIGSLILDLR